MTNLDSVLLRLAGILLVFLLIHSERAFSQDPVWVQVQDTEGMFISDISVFLPDPDSIYALSGALLLSTNGGDRWDSIAPGACCGVLAVDPSDSRRLFLNATGLPFEGNALRLSTDRGLSWAELFHGICHEDIGCAAPFIEYGPNPDQAVYSSMNPVFILRSNDGGITWDTLSTPPEQGLWSIAVSRLDPQILYAAFASPLRVLRSNNNGTTWTDLPFPLPGVETAVYLAVDPRDHDVVYAAVDGFGVFKTSDGGQLWMEMNGGLLAGDRDIHVITLNPHNPDDIFLGLEDDNSFDGESNLVFVSADGGLQWTRLASGLPLSGHVSALSIDPREFRILASVNTLDDSSKASGIYQFGPSVSVSSNPDGPSTVHLFQNSPNPFNSETTLRFNLERRSNVRISLFSLPGELVKVLLHEEMAAGEHQILFEAGGLATGVYFYALETERTRMVRRMTLLR